jgi:serine/threonine-protein kinase
MNNNTTTFFDVKATLTFGGHVAKRCPDELLSRYQRLLDDQRLNWTEHHRLLRLLGTGGQGAVYLSERRGTDGFTLPVALKVFCRAQEDARSYDEAMARMASGARVADPARQSARRTTS